MKENESRNGAFLRPRILPFTNSPKVGVFRRFAIYTKSLTQSISNQKYNEAYELFYKNNYEGAIKLYNEAIELNPNYAEAYKFRGMTYQRMGKTAKAEADFAKAKQLGYNF